MQWDSTTKKFIVAVILAFMGYFGAGLYFDEVQSRLIGTVILLVTLWTNEALSLGVVSLLPIILFPSLEILTTAQTAVNYSKSIIFLFLGGFMIAIAVEKQDCTKSLQINLSQYFPKVQEV